MMALDALERAGVSYRQLDYWTRRGYVYADKATPGSGNRRQYSMREVRVLTQMADLVKNGHVDPDKAATVARELVDTGQAQLTDSVLLVASP